MITVLDVKTESVYKLDSLNGKVPVLLIRDHLCHLSNNELNSYNMISNAEILEDASIIDADMDRTLFAVPHITEEGSVLSSHHVAVLQDLITQMQTNDKALSFLEHNIGSKKIPSTLIAHLISSKSRRKLLDSNEAQSFLRANPCILKFLDTLHGQPGVLTSHNTLGSLANMFGQDTSQRSRSNANRSSGTNIITPEMFQQALNGVLQNAGDVGSSSSAPRNEPVEPRGTGAVPMEGVTEGMSNIQHQMQERAPQLAQLHAMGLTDDLQNIQALQATGGNVEAAIELLFSDM